MKISIVTPIYNGEKFLSKMIENVLPLLSESVDWIIVDDKSTDETFSKLKEMVSGVSGVSITQLNKNSGPSVARAEGVKISSSDYIYLLDADDIITKNFLGFLFFIKDNKGYDFYYAPLKVIRNYNDTPSINAGLEQDVDKVRTISKPTDFIKFGFPQPSSLVINKDFFLNNIITDRLEWGEDFLLYLQLSKYGKGIRWSKVVSCYLIDGSGRGSKLSIKMRHKLSVKLLDVSLKKNKVLNCLAFTAYLSLRHLISYSYKKIIKRKNK